MSTNFISSVAGKVKANRKVIKNNDVVVRKLSLQTRCQCAHRDENGKFALITPNAKSPKSPYTEAPLYRCSICEETMDLSPITEERLLASIDTINSLLNIAKMKIDFRSEKDRKIFNQISKIIYRNYTLVPDIYKMVQNGKKKKNNHDTRNNITILR